MPAAMRGRVTCCLRATATLTGTSKTMFGTCCNGPSGRSPSCTRCVPTSPLARHGPTVTALTISASNLALWWVQNAGQRATKLSKTSGDCWHYPSPCVWRTQPHLLSTRPFVRLTKLSSRISLATMLRNPRACGLPVVFPGCARRDWYCPVSSMASIAGPTRPIVGRTGCRQVMIAGLNAARRILASLRLSVRSMVRG